MIFDSLEIGLAMMLVVVLFGAHQIAYLIDNKEGQK